MKGPAPAHDPMMLLRDSRKIIRIIKHRGKTRLLQKQSTARQLALESHPGIPLALVFRELDV